MIIVQNKSHGLVMCLARDHTDTGINKLFLEPRVISDGVVPGEPQFAKEAGLPSWFSTVVWRVKVNVGC